mgnify:CR=1 FL=1
MYTVVLVLAMLSLIALCALVTRPRGWAIAGFVTANWLMTGFHYYSCLLYTSDAADERSSVDLGGRRIIKKKNELQSCVSVTLSTNIAEIRLDHYSENKRSNGE